MSAVLIQCHQTTQRSRVESLKCDHTHRAVAGMDLVPRQKFDTLGGKFANCEFRRGLFYRISERESLRLCETIADGKLRLRRVAARRLRRHQQVECRTRSTLVQHLEE
jgi:hypothetical protein